MDRETRSKYLKFVAMIATSMALMFAVMYLHTYQLDHVRWSETRLYMTLLMGASMALVMLGFMRHMYTSARGNLAIVVGSLLLFAIALWGVRSQALVSDVAYMKGMIPHHSIAILTSERSGLEDVRVRKLADEIIAAQKREIAEMDFLIRDIGENGEATTEAEAAGRPVPEFGSGPSS